MNDFGEFINPGLQTSRPILCGREINCQGSVSESNVIPNNIGYLEKRQREATFIEDLLYIRYLIYILFSSCNHQNNTILTVEEIKE